MSSYRFFGGVGFWRARERFLQTKERTGTTWKSSLPIEVPFSWPGKKVLSGEAPRASTVEEEGLLPLKRVVQVEGFLRGALVVNDGADGLEHGDGVIGLEDVAAHIHTGGALLDGFVSEFESLELRAVSCRRQ